jgi:hypothetical protein
MSHSSYVTGFIIIALAIISGAVLFALVPHVSAQDTGHSVPSLTVGMQRCDVTQPLSSQHCTDDTTAGQVTVLQKFLTDYLM